MMNLNRIRLLFVLLISVIVVHTGEAQFDAVKKKLFSKGTLKKGGSAMSGMGLAAPLEDLVIDRPYRVFGSEPSWMLSKDGSFDRYYFNLLTDLVIGEYDINPKTGVSRNPNALKLYKEVKKKDKGKKADLSIVDRANQYNSAINVHILVTFYGDYGEEGYAQTYYDLLLSDAAIQKNIMDSLAKEVDYISTTYGISESRIGLLLDFKNIPPSDYGAFIKFVSFLSENFKSIGMKLPPITSSVKGRIPRTTLHELNDYVNYFIVEAHGYEELLNPSEVARLIELIDNRFIIEKTFKYYADTVLKPKIILELPYYGTSWEYTNDGTYVIKPDNSHPPLDLVYKTVGKSGKVNYTEGDTTLAFFRTDKGGTVAYLFDDFKTFDRKYKWLDSMGCKGIGIWALGYCSANDEESKNLWAAIGKNFGTVKTGMGWIIAAFLTLFLPLGFFYSVVSSWEVRNAVAKHRKYFFNFLLAFVFVVFIFLFCANIIPRTTVGLMIGMAIMLGFYIYMRVKKYLATVKKYQKMAQ